MPVASLVIAGAVIISQDSHTDSSSSIINLITVMDSCR